MIWRWASASEIGTSHIKLGTRKQDAIASFLTGTSKEVFCGIVCDGAGSARFGGEGASLVCRILSQALRIHFKTTTLFPSNDLILTWLDKARNGLSLAAKVRNVEKKAFASTLVLLLAQPNEQLAIHIGDGAIVGRDLAGEWQTMSCPENGEYASMTYFVSDEPIPKIRIVRSTHAMDGFCLFSDGIEDLALDRLSSKPHEPFFQTMISPLDKLNTSGKDATLSKALGNFLAGSRVCEKTDDDKSLILVSVK